MPKYKGIYKRKNKKGGYTWYAYVDYNFKKYHVPGGYRSAEEARDARADFEKKQAVQESALPDHFAYLLETASG